MVVMLAELLPTEMAFGRKIAEHKVRGREETIDEHPVKPLAFEVEEDLRGSWKRALVRKHLALLAALRDSSPTGGSSLAATAMRGFVRGQRDGLHPGADRPSRGRVCAQ